MCKLDSIENTAQRVDISEIAASEFLNNLEARAAILITGATGLLGSLMVKALAWHNVCTGKQMRIIALVRDPEKARTMLSGFLSRGDVEICVADVTQEIHVQGAVDYVIHGASATSSRFFVENPVETIETALRGTRNILNLARQKNVKKVVYLSSLEVYGTPDGSKAFVTETDYGYLDPMQVRSSYSEGKRMAECLCTAYSKEYGVPVVVARLSQTFGAGVSYGDGRVFAEFARCAIEGRNIVLHTKGNTVRTYCYTSDAIRAIFCLLVRGQAGEAYNVTNMDTAVSIREMAQLVCGLVPEQGIQLRFDTPENLASFGYNPEMVIRLDSRKLQNLGWRPEVCLREMFSRMIESMRQDA